MTKEDKELLLKDLSARLPYGVKISYGNKIYLLSIPYLEDIKNIVLGHEYSRGYNIKNISIKPYLRPMSSMTNEEKRELKELHFYYTDDHIINEEDKYFKPIVVDEVHCSYIIDWLNRKMFDYRGLIEKGLALEALEGMYNIKEK